MFWRFANGPIKLLPHKLLLDKLNAYEFSLSTLRFICRCIFNRQPRTKINIRYSFWEKILFRISQGSILGPSLFNIFICDLFIALILLAMHTTVHPLYLKNVVSSIESCSTSLFEWFSNNQMKANPEKCHLLINVNRPATIKIGEHTISNSYYEKLFGAKIDSQLNFNNHLETIIKKASQNVNVLVRVRPLCKSY